MTKCPTLTILAKEAGLVIILILEHIGIGITI